MPTANRSPISASLVSKHYCPSSNIRQPTHSLPVIDQIPASNETSNYTTVRQRASCNRSRPDGVGSGWKTLYPRPIHHYGMRGEILHLRHRPRRLDLCRRLDLGRWWCSTRWWGSSRRRKNRRPLPGGLRRHGRWFRRWAQRPDPDHVEQDARPQLTRLRVFGSHCRGLIRWVGRQRRH